MIFGKSKVPRLSKEDLDNLKPDLDFTDTTSMMVEMESAKNSVSSNKVTITPEVADLLVSQVLKLTKLAQKHSERLAKLEEEAGVNKTALFAYTDSNDLGQRGIFHQMDDVKRFFKWTVAGIVALAGFIGWLLTHVLPIIVNSGLPK